MYDAFLKSVFSDRRLVEILIRDHAREWAGELDFSTLREESTQLISKKTLEQRHPDLIWSADTLDGGRVLFLLEFQRTVERLMALRTTTYAALALERIATSEEFRVGRQLPEFVYLVLYHATAAGPLRLASWTCSSARIQVSTVWFLGRWYGEDPSRDDLAALVLGLARDLSAEDMAAQLSALRIAVEDYGDAGLDAFLFEMMYAMLELRDYPEGLTQLRERTMAEMVDRFQRSLDKLVQKGARQGQVLVLRRIIAKKFGDDRAGQLSAFLDDVSGSEDIDRVTDALIECATEQEFIERMQMA